ncbi:hypothetical protein Fmac_001537 [Flemingia macrophylla]|uniref:Uncharacterized protein n=1 Tax=Flemingia macrophylla TaxID=520843 RepID=A0ABD1NIN1_9FABA
MSPNCHAGFNPLSSLAGEEREWVGVKWFTEFRVALSSSFLPPEFAQCFSEYGLNNSYRVYCNCLPSLIVRC